MDKLNVHTALLGSFVPRRCVVRVPRGHLRLCLEAAGMSELQNDAPRPQKGRHKTCWLDNGPIDANAIGTPKAGWNDTQAIQLTENSTQLSASFTKWEK